MWKLIYRFDLVRPIRRLWCLVVGHDVPCGTRWSYGPDRCARCWYSESEINLEETTLPMLLNRIYGWLIEQDWGWFERFDMWAIEHWPSRLPDWWSY